KVDPGSDRRPERKPVSEHDNKKRLAALRVLTFLIQRWLLLVPTLALASVFIFAIVTLAPGDPVRAKLGTEATPQQVAAERARLGLDQPLPTRYAVWLSDVAHLNLGRSLINGRQVTTLITDAFPNTLRLALT